MVCELKGQRSRLGLVYSTGSLECDITLRLDHIATVDVDGGETFVY